MPNDRLSRELPLVSDRRERGDAAANRQRILCAARRLLVAYGPAGVSMDAVAATAGVGKGTVFRRFGDRAGLMGELASDYMRDFQDRFLSGPPPLGPGAPPAERLEAFVTALISLQREHLSIALAAEVPPEDAPTGAYGALLLHAAALVRELDPRLNADIVATLILGAIAPPVLHRLAADPDEITASAIGLLHGLT
jgi:AcrR family transcriptional regulator